MKASSFYEAIVAMESRIAWNSYTFEELKTIQSILKQLQQRVDNALDNCE